MLLLAALAVQADTAEFSRLGSPGDLISLEVEQAGQPVLQGHNAGKQLLVVTGVYSSGQRHHLTHRVKYAVDKPNVVAIAADRE